MQTSVMVSEAKPSRFWHRAFLQERSAMGLSFFRIFVALTVGLHVIPSFFHMDDNYLSTAFKELNPSSFPSRSCIGSSRVPTGWSARWSGAFTCSGFSF